MPGAAVEFKRRQRLYDLNRVSDDGAAVSRSWAVAAFARAWSSMGRWTLHTHILVNREHAEQSHSAYPRRILLYLVESSGTPRSGLQRKVGGVPALLGVPLFGPISLHTFSKKDEIRNHAPPTDPQSQRRHGLTLNRC